MPNKTYRLEFATNKDFDFAQRVGFTTVSITDGTMKRNLANLTLMANAGQIAAVPADASVEDLQNSVALDQGESAPEGVLGYHSIPIRMRLVEVLPKGTQRAGGTEFTLEGFGAPAAADIV